MATAATLSERIRANPLSAAALAVALAAALTLAGAWFFELVIGLEPCPLCLDQRVPYYIAVPLGLALARLASAPARAHYARIGLALLGIVMLVGAGYGVYHAGVEWGFWQGPTACAGTTATPGDILSQLKTTTRVVSCSEAPWRFLGLSLAGYNVLIAGALAALSFWAAFAQPRST
ncbi:MAG: disulfide bond formation protein B [Bradyrhizobiaceae bacterium]|nr:disulfide bond formation protein B [Bradyrhizobiaceae bacterium]